MFRQRTSSQKPGAALLANFRQQFPEVVAAVSTASNSNPTTAPDDSGLSVPVEDDRPQNLSPEAFQDQDPTPRATSDSWRLTPSLLDSNSFSFNQFGNAPAPPSFAPTPGGIHTIYHPQAGDLHTPTLGMSMGLNTPISIPTTDGAAAATAISSNQQLMDMTGFQALHPHQLHHFNPFIQAPAPLESTSQPQHQHRHQIQPQQQQQQQHPPPRSRPRPQSFAHPSFIHHDTGYETMDYDDGSPIGSDLSVERMTSIDSALHDSPLLGMQPGHHQFTASPRGGGFSIAGTLPASAERFRFHSTLNAPTAMIRHMDEIPITYLNKGQAYSLSIVDTNGTVPVVPGTRYRTYVRISFEDEQQRQRPGVCWSLWKEGRGTSESHQRGGKLQAVEYVEAGQPAEGDDRRTRTELESFSFDGFSVIWTPGINGGTEVSIAVRFNFLSTDFSHSKGVKGIPVRLCAKTTPFPIGSSASVPLPPPPPPSEANGADGEICFCKVKLFRDHGAERKLSNDVAHVKKTIDKLKQQISQAESGMKEFGKRKRGSSAMVKGGGGIDGQRPAKVQKHKRTWSMSSASSAGGGVGVSDQKAMATTTASAAAAAAAPTAEEDLHAKLQTLQDMFTSTRPVSILYLRGEDGDDPDLHPVTLASRLPEPLQLDTTTREGPAWQVRNSGKNSITGSLVSPSPSSLSLTSQASAIGTAWTTSGLDVVGGTGAKVLEQVTKVGRTDDAGNLSGWIETLGVDPSYRPPAPDRGAPKPVACFYVLRKRTPPAAVEPLSQTRREYYRAVYLWQRTAREFQDRVAAKYGMDPTRILRTVRCVPDATVTKTNTKTNTSTTGATPNDTLEVELDDDMMREMREGQDMVLEIEDAGGGRGVGVKKEWDTMASPVGDLATADSGVQAANEGFLLRVTF